MFHGVLGHPYLDLEPFIGTEKLAQIDREICLNLPQVEVGYTGSSLKWMGVVAPEVEADPYIDSMRLIEQLDESAIAELVSLADEPDLFDADRLQKYTFGDETDHPLNKRQMLYLKYKYGVYFPWKVLYPFVLDQRWEDKNSGQGKSFTEESCEMFPRTVTFLKSLPFQEIGRCVLFGLEGHDHAPLHRDTLPSDAPVDHSITICPRGDKRFYLATDDPSREQLIVNKRVYWFNDMDWHGVLPDRFFRYSIRVDGVFQPTFLERLVTYYRSAAR